jgi:hypothetical protein
LTLHIHAAGRIVPCGIFVRKMSRKGVTSCGLFVPFLQALWICFAYIKDVVGGDKYDIEYFILFRNDKKTGDYS